MTPKLDVGKVFNRIFELYTSQASVYLPAALILYLPLAIVTGAVLTGTGGLFVLLLLVALGFVTAFIYQGRRGAQRGGPPGRPARFLDR